MPAKIDNVKIQGTMYDRRRKLTEEDKETIKHLYETTDISIHRLATDFGVSRRTIQFILFPDRLAVSKDRIKKNWRKYYDRKDLAETTKKVRAYKTQLQKDGKI